VTRQPVRGALSDSPTARELAARLPITLSFHDLNGNEKIARLPAPLTPDGADPDIADIGYYAPTQDLRRRRLLERHRPNRTLRHRSGRPRQRLEAKHLRRHH
jgi:hypothetical protein